MARRNIVERYIRADIEKRVEIILDNYGMFNRILDGYEQSLSIVIRNERDYNRKNILRKVFPKVSQWGIVDMPCSAGCIEHRAGSCRSAA